LGTDLGAQMRKLLLTLAVSALLAGPAAATDKTDVMAVIHQWVDGFNKGDMKAMAATCADQASIIDDIAPHEWHGAGACTQWSSDFQAFAQAAAMTEPAVTVGKPWHINVNGDRAYVVAPTTVSYQQKGKAVVEKAIVTMALQKNGAAWRITGWAWADH
jgi:ketosteroid isomerase-like protein